MKYFVVAVVWDSKKNAQVHKIIGTFERITDAVIFKEAFNEHYHSNAGIVESFDMVNAFYNSI